MSALGQTFVSPRWQVSMASWQFIPGSLSADHASSSDPRHLEGRRRAIPGVKLCIDCQSERGVCPVMRGAINRRGSKDSQLN